MQAEIEILEVEKRIRTRVKKQMEKTQKEYYLNEQMRAIQKELGEQDEFKNEIQELEEKIKKKKMSAEATREGREGAQEAQDDVADVAPRRPSSATTSTGSSRCPGTSTPRTSSTSTRPRRSSTRTTTASRRSKERILEYLAVQSAGRPAEGADPLPRRAARRRQDLARQVDRARDGPRSSCASRSAACATRPRSAATAAPTSARCPARSSSR